MRNLIINVSLSLMSFVANAQDMTSVMPNRIRITDADSVVLFEVNAYSKQQETDPLKHYYWYSANEIHITQGGFSGKPLNGTYTSFYTNKQLKEKGAFNKGLKYGVWKKWTPQGILIQENTWDRGLQTGVFAEYDPAGNLKRTGFVINGELNGKIVTYQTSSPPQTQFYKKGKPVAEPQPFLKRINIFKKGKTADSTSVSRQPGVKPVQ